MFLQRRMPQSMLERRSKFRCVSTSRSERCSHSRSVPVYSLRTERGVGGILEVSNHNSLGKARVLGLQSRYDRQLREARFYLSQPMLRVFPAEDDGQLVLQRRAEPHKSNHRRVRHRVGRAPPFNRKSSFATRMSRVTAIAMSGRRPSSLSNRPRPRRLPCPR